MRLKNLWILSLLLVVGCGGGGGASGGSGGVGGVEPIGLVSIQVTGVGLDKIAVGTTTSFVATGVYTDGSTKDLTTAVAWSSSETGVASVSNESGTKGLAEGRTSGETFIFASFFNLFGKATLTVSDATPTALSVTPTNPSIAVGTQVAATATATFSDMTTQDVSSGVEWTSTDNGIASVTTGIVKGLAKGSVTISATFVGTLRAETQVTVTDAKLNSIQVEPVTGSIAEGTSQPFQAIGNFSDGSTQDLTSQSDWASTQQTVATVSNSVGSKGAVVGVRAGETTIQASFAGLSGAGRLTVTESSLSRIEITPVNPSIAFGTAIQFFATGIFSNGTVQDLTSQALWRAFPPGIASISAVGRATATKDGDTTVSATFLRGLGETMLTVTPTSITFIDITPASAIIPLKFTASLSATGRTPSGTIQDLTPLVQWSVSDSTIATVSNAIGSSGVITPIVPGTTTVFADFGKVRGSAMITVTDSSLQAVTVTALSSNLPIGTTTQLTAMGTFSSGPQQDITAQVTWGSSDPTAVTVSNAATSRGVATGVAAGKRAEITATFGTVVSAPLSLTVTQAVLTSISVSCSLSCSLSLAGAPTLPLTAVGTYSDGSLRALRGEEVWSSSNPNVATVSNALGSRGLVTAMEVGNTTLSATVQLTTGSVVGSTVLTVTP